MNQYDTQSIRERFIKAGFKEVTNSNKADTYLINTCTVTSSADNKSKSVILRAIRENPLGKVIVTGCMVKKDRYLLSKLKGVSFIVSKTFFRDGISNFSAHTRAFLKIQDGCNNSCSYCKVPLVRGRSRSRPLSEILNDAELLAEQGFKEIVLSGICLGSYGQDLTPKSNLVDVIDCLDKIKGVLRIRLSSIEAGDVSDSLISVFSKSKKLCHHLHIPIQSGDDQILKKMKRRYNAKFYLKLIGKIRKNIPDIAITTDCLVGFPGETQKNFMNTLKLVKRIQPLRVHIFPYSKREGTLSGMVLGQDVDKDIIKKRIELLKQIALTCASNFKRDFIGQDTPVLFEAKSKEKQGYWEGYTGNYIKVLFKSNGLLKNKLIKVRLKSMSGELVFAS